MMVLRKLVVVRPSESHHIHLIGITERGIRLYFSTFPTRGGGSLSSYVFLFCFVFCLFEI